MNAVRPVSLAWPRAAFERRADGGLLVRPVSALADYPARFTTFVEHWAEATPDHPAVLARLPDGRWAGPTYAQLLGAARAIGQALLDRGLGPERPVAILCGNGIPHLLMTLACLHVGVPAGPISMAYVRGGASSAKLRHCLGLLGPGLVLTDPALAEVAAQLAPDAEIVSTDTLDRVHAEPGPAVEAATARVGADTVAKILFTSGSTGEPKGVITTHGMLCSNQQMLRQTFPVLCEESSVLVDWLPWNHVFGGSHNLGLALANGCTLYIDEGRPLPGQFDATAENLRDVAPTLYYNVPAGYAHLADRLETDPALRKNFFSRLKMMFYAAASLPQTVWDRMDALAQATTGQRVQWMTGLGSTETAPFCLSCRPDNMGAGVVGLPAPGITLKLAPVGDKLEARVRGPNVTPGYWRDPAQTASLFDEEGFLRMGDALAPVDPGDLQLGFRFDGRVAEDFKLTSGTWVSTGPLRVKLLEVLGSHVRDLVIAGLDRDYLAVLAIPHAPGAADEAAVRKALARHAEGAGASTCVRRLAWLTAPLSIDAGELTDKGSLNQRGVLRRHQALVDQLCAEPPGAGVICAP